MNEKYLSKVANIQLVNVLLILRGFLPRLQVASYATTSSERSRLLILKRLMMTIGLSTFMKSAEQEVSFAFQTSVKMRLSLCQRWKELTGTSLVAN